MLIRLVAVALTVGTPVYALAQQSPSAPPVSPAVPAGTSPDAAPKADQDPGALIYIDPTLRKGSSIKLDVTTLKETASRNSKPQKQQSSVEVLIEVLDVTEDGTSKIAWTQTIPRAAADAEAMGEDPAAEILLAMNGLRLEFGLTADGELTALDNFEAVHKRLTTVVEAALEKRRQAGTSEEALGAVRAMVTDLYADEGRATAVIMKEPNLYFQIYGYELEAGKPVEYETELGNPMGGVPYPAAGTWRLDGFNPKATPAPQRFKVRWQQKVNEAEAVKIVVQTLREMADKVGKPMPESEAAKLLEMQFEISDDGTYLYNRETGFIESLRYKRTTVADHKRNSETVTFSTRE